MSQKPNSDGSGGVQRFNHLAAAEMGAEQNYNQIDGIINNEPKPSIVEFLREHKPQPNERGHKPERGDGLER